MICRLLFYFLLAAVAVNGLSSARAEEKNYDAENAAQEEFDGDVLDIFDMPEKEIRIMIKKSKSGTKTLF